MESSSIHALMGVVILSACLSAQDTMPVRAPKEALLFKSGQSYLYREASLTGSEQKVRLRLPPGIHGTIWLESDSTKIVSTRAMTIDTTVETEVSGLADSLQMAVGEEVILDCADADKVMQFRGRLVRILSVPMTASYAYPQTFALQSTQVPATVTAVVLEFPEVAGRARQMVLPIARIVGVSLLKPSSGWTFQSPRKIPVLEAELEPKVGRAGRLGLSYMAEGLAWAPSYAIDLGADGTAHLIGKAVIMNDLEDLVDTRVRLVVGYPNIKFAHVRSGLIPDVTIALFRGMLSSPNSPVSVMGQQVMFNGIMSNVGRPTRSVGVSDKSVAGESAEDLFLYDLGLVSLRRGERAYRPFLDQKVSFAHRFDWNISDRVDNRGYYRPDGDKTTPVWHVLRLDNKSTEPWTTAPILIRTDKGPLAQSQIMYTPSGSEAIVRLTKALNLVAETVEYRADAAASNRKTTRLFGTTYEMIVVKCEMSVSNRGASAAPVRIQKELSGDLIEADGDPKVTGRAKSLGRVNAARTLRWEFDLPVGETWKAEYSYRVFIRR